MLPAGEKNYHMLHQYELGIAVDQYHHILRCECDRVNSAVYRSEVVALDMKVLLEFSEMRG